VPKLADVRVHVDPREHDGMDPHAELAHHDHDHRGIASKPSGLSTS
jgi:hypothetical protein